MWKVNSVAQWTYKFAMRNVLLAGAATLLVPLALAPAVHAQVSISINPPICSYGYYNYAPYGCAPSGYYGPGYFYNNVFLGVGPWANWGYGHGWGGHRFVSSGGGRYVGGRGGRVYAANRGRGPTPHAYRSNSPHGNVARGGSHSVPAHANAPRGTSHAAAPHGGGSHADGPHGGGEHH